MPPKGKTLKENIKSNKRKLKRSAIPSLHLFFFAMEREWQEVFIRPQFEKWDIIGEVLWPNTNMLQHKR